MPSSSLSPRTSAIVLLLAGAILGLPGQDGGLPVYQDLEEATARIPRIKDKPFQRLYSNGFTQSEVLVFKDVETGSEVWSLSREAGTDIANIERRCAWSCDGRYISFIGNSAYWNLAKNELSKRPWPGHNWIARADGGERRKLWGMNGGKPQIFCDKFNNWDQKRPGVLYYPQDDGLWRITLGSGEQDNRAELIHRFPNKQPRIVQEISDDNLMLIEESGKTPNCYVVNLDRDPKDPLFCLTQPLKGEVHPGSFRFRRGQTLVTGGYEAKGLGPIRYQVDPAKGTFTEVPVTEDPFKREMWHVWYGPPDDRCAFSGKVPGIGEGLFVHVPGSKPVLLAKVSDGHPSWCGHDPEWFFYAVGTPDTDSPFSRHLVAGNADGRPLVKVCTPFDRHRGGKQGYDAIPRPNQSPDATKCWFHSSMLSASDEHTASFVAVFRRPQAPVAVSATGSQVAWKPHRLSSEVRGYHVYRSTDGGKTWDEASRGIVSGTSFSDPAGAKGASYAVTAEEWSGLESDVATVSAGGPSATISGWDKAAPAKAEGFTVRVEDGMPRLSWKASTDPGLRHYQIYASASGRPEAVQRRRIVSPRSDETTYLDWTAPAGGVPSYALTVVDRQGNESEPVFADGR